MLFLTATTGVALLLISVIGTPLPYKDLGATGKSASTSASITPSSPREQCLHQVDQYKTTYQIRTGESAVAYLLKDLEDECNEKSDYKSTVSLLHPSAAIVKSSENVRDVSDSSTK